MKKKMKGKKNTVMQWIGEGIEATKMENQIEYVWQWVYNKEQENMKEQGSMNLNVINSKREIGESSKMKERRGKGIIWVLKRQTERVKEMI